MTLYGPDWARAVDAMIAASANNRETRRIIVSPLGMAQYSPMRGRPDAPGNRSGGGANFDPSPTILAQLAQPHPISPNLAWPPPPTVDTLSPSEEERREKPSAVALEPPQGRTDD